MFGISTMLDVLFLVPSGSTAGNAKLLSYPSETRTLARILCSWRQPITSQQCNCRDVRHQRNLRVSHPCYRYSLFLAVQLQGKLSYCFVRLPTLVRIRPLFWWQPTTCSTAEMLGVSRMFDLVFLIPSSSTAGNAKLLSYTSEPPTLARILCSWRQPITSQQFNCREVRH